jgi:hypothetical protein
MENNNDIKAIAKKYTSASIIKSVVSLRRELLIISTKRSTGLLSENRSTFLFWAFATDFNAGRYLSI